MAIQEAVIKVTRWSGGEHPTLSKLTRQMNKEGLRPYTWEPKPNQRFAVRSHGYDKVLYVVNGVVEITLPDKNQKLRLRSGDRIDIPARIRHGSIAGQKGATCLEAALR